MEDRTSRMRRSRMIGTAPLLFLPVLALAAIPDGGDTGDAQASCSRLPDGGARHQRIIHAASTLAAFADGGLAQMPLATAYMVVPTIQAVMVYGIGLNYGCKISLAGAGTVVTYLASNHVKKAFMKELVGWIPGAGNIVKGSITFFMTEGIGTMADEMLRCPRNGREELLAMAREQGEGHSESTRDAPETTDHGASHGIMAPLFHFVLKHLLDGETTPAETWEQAKHLFSAEGHAELLAKVNRTEEAEGLVKVVRVYFWNMEVVGAALKKLEQRFARPTACSAAHFLVGRFWADSASSASDAEASSAVAPYLGRCARHIAKPTQRLLMRSLKSLLQEESARHGRSLPSRRDLLQHACRLLEEVLDASEGEAGEENSEQPGSAELIGRGRAADAGIGGERDEAEAEAEAEDDADAERVPGSVELEETLNVDDLRAVSAAVLAIYLRLAAEANHLAPAASGEFLQEESPGASSSVLASPASAACRALRALLRADRQACRIQKEGSQTTAGSWITLRQIQALDRIEKWRSDTGAELCHGALRSDFVERLTLETMPPEAEPAFTTSPAAVSTTSLPSGRWRRGAIGSAGLGGAGLEELLGEPLKGVVGQRCAVERLVREPGYAQLRHRGLWASDRPLVLLLTGPSGTGKTMLSRLLAEALLGRPVAELEAQGRFRTFHMNLFALVEDQKSFFGPPKGVQGGTGDLPELLKRHPDAVILLDEVEKAHPSFARALLKVFGEHGAVYDPKTGQDFPSNNATFLLTSNFAKELIQRHAAASSAGTQDLSNPCASYSSLQKEVFEALRQPTSEAGRENFFRESELRSRLADVLPFVPFSTQEVQAAVRGFLGQEAVVFREKSAFLHTRLSWQPDVVPLLAAEYRRRPEGGLRGVQVQLQTRVRKLFDSALEAGLLDPRGQPALLLLRQAPALGAGLASGDDSALDLRLVRQVPKEDSAPEEAESYGWASPRYWWASPRSPRRSPGPQPKGPGLGMPGGARSWPEEPEEGSAAWGPGGEAEDWIWAWEEWDWQIAWAQLFDFLWQWRWAIAVFSVMLLAAVLASAAPCAPLQPTVSTFIGGAASASTAVPPAAAAASLTNIWPNAATAMILQLAATAGSTAVPLFTAGFAYYYRHELAALIWFIVMLLTTPRLCRVLLSRRPSAPASAFRKAAPFEDASFDAAPGAACGTCSASASQWDLGGPRLPASPARARQLFFRRTAAAADGNMPTASDTAFVDEEEEEEEEDVLFTDRSTGTVLPPIAPAGKHQSSEDSDAEKAPNREKLPGAPGFQALVEPVPHDRLGGSRDADRSEDFKMEEDEELEAAAQEQDRKRTHSTTFLLSEDVLGGTGGVRRPLPRRRVSI